MGILRTVILYSRPSHESNSVLSLSRLLSWPTNIFGDWIRPDGAQQPGLIALFISQNSVSYSPASVLSQLLEKQRKLIAINDKALRVWPRL